MKASAPNPQPGPAKFDLVTVTSLETFPASGPRPWKLGIDSLRYLPAT